MGVSASWIRADWRQHDDAWPGAAVFHPPLEFDGRPGGAVFLDTIFRKFSGHGGDQLAFAAHGFYEGDQRRVFLFRPGFGVPWTWAVVFFDGVRGDLRARVRPVKSLDQSTRDAFAFCKRGGGGKFAELLVGDRRRLKPIPGGFFSGTYETAPDRKSTRLNSSHANISYAVFSLKKKKTRLNSRHAMSRIPFVASEGKHLAKIVDGDGAGPYRIREKRVCARRANLARAPRARDDF